MAGAGAAGSGREGGPTARPRVGFVGVGEMGSAMLRCLLDAGLEVAAYDVRPDVFERFRSPPSPKRCHDAVLAHARHAAAHRREPEAYAFGRKVAATARKDLGAALEHARCVGVELPAVAFALGELDALFGVAD